MADHRARMDDKRFYALLVWSVIIAIFVMATVLSIWGK